MVMVLQRRFSPATARSTKSNSRVIWARLLPALNGRFCAAEIGNDASDHHGSMRLSIVGPLSLQTRLLHRRIAITRPCDADGARTFPPSTVTDLLVGVSATEADDRRG